MAAPRPLNAGGRGAKPSAKRTEVTEALLASAGPNTGPSWLQSARDAAEARFADMGAPLRGDEYWRNTNPAPFIDAHPNLQDAGDVALALDAAPLRVVFTDGRFDADASDALALEGADISVLSTGSDIHWAADVIGTLEARAQIDVPRPLAAWNTARATDGVLIRATGAVERPILIETRGGASDPILHHVIFVEEGASLTVLEQGPAENRSSQGIEARVAKGGALHHLRLQPKTAHHLRASFLFASLAQDAQVKSFTLATAGILTRNEAVFWLDGDDAAAHVAGAAIGDAADAAFHHDDTVFITHDALNGESRQVFKKVLRNGAVGVFQGKILVKDGAQKTDGYQISQSLLLDDDSQFLAKPELEIYADDVACSHGSTTGAIDETALFYLRSRGVSKRDATDMLVLSFLAEALDEIEDEAMRDAVATLLEAWLKP
ncbi:MAG: SufD family Fe-S cluster assembly protein [Pseudomonadota bacterium]